MDHTVNCVGGAAVNNSKLSQGVMMSDCGELGRSVS